MYSPRYYLSENAVRSWKKKKKKKKNVIQERSQPRSTTFRRHQNNKRWGKTRHTDTITALKCFQQKIVNKRLRVKNTFSPWFIIDQFNVFILLRDIWAHSDILENRIPLQSVVMVVVVVVVGEGCVCSPAKYIAVTFRVWMKPRIRFPLSSLCFQGQTFKILFTFTECVESYHYIHSKVLPNLSSAEVHDCCTPTPVLYDGVFQCIHNIGGLCSATAYPQPKGKCMNDTCTAEAQVR